LERKARTYYEREEPLISGDPCPSCGEPVSCEKVVQIYSVTYYHSCPKGHWWVWDTREA